MSVHVEQTRYHQPRPISAVSVAEQDPSRTSLGKLEPQGDVSERPFDPSSHCIFLHYHDSRDTTHKVTSTDYCNEEIRQFSHACDRKPAFQNHKIKPQAPTKTFKAPVPKHRPAPVRIADSRPDSEYPLLKLGSVQQMLGIDGLLDENETGQVKLRRQFTKGGWLYPGEAPRPWCKVALSE